MEGRTSLLRRRVLGELIEDMEVSLVLDLSYDSSLRYRSRRKAISFLITTLRRTWRRRRFERRMSKDANTTDLLQKIVGNLSSYGFSLAVEHDFEVLSLEDEGKTNVIEVSFELAPPSTRHPSFLRSDHEKGLI